MYLIKNDDIVNIIPKGFIITESLAPGNWIVKVSEDDGYYLQKSDPFTLPEKLYGNITPDSDKYLKVFNRGESNLGVLLRGYKGTGKSLTAKKVCINSGLPVLIITQSYVGSDFLTFLNGIKDECIIFIDEFDKLYGYQVESRTDTQESLLSLMDGSIEGTKKLFLLTANSGGINSALLNRPGRVRYDVKYGGLKEDIIIEILKDTLEDHSKIDQILNVFESLGKVNMDSIKSLVDEVNFWPKEPVIDLANHMNISPEEGDYVCTWEEPGGVSFGSNSNSGKINRCIIEGHPLGLESLYLGNNLTVAGESHISIKECEVLESGYIVKLKYMDVIFKFEPKEDYNFKFTSKLPDKIKK